MTNLIGSDRQEKKTDIDSKNEEHEENEIGIDTAQAAHGIGGTSAYEDYRVAEDSPDGGVFYNDETEICRDSENVKAFNDNTSVNKEMEISYISENGDEKAGLDRGSDYGNIEIDRDSDGECVEVDTYSKIEYDSDITSNKNDIPGYPIGRELDDEIEIERAQENNGKEKNTALENDLEDILDEFNEHVTAVSKDEPFIEEDNLINEKQIVVEIRDSEEENEYTKAGTSSEMSVVNTGTSAIDCYSDCAQKVVIMFDRSVKGAAKDNTCKHLPNEDKLTENTGLCTNSEACEVAAQELSAIRQLSLQNSSDSDDSSPDVAVLSEKNLDDIQDEFSIDSDDANCNRNEFNRRQTETNDTNLVDLSHGRDCDYEFEENKLNDTCWCVEDRATMNTEQTSEFIGELYFKKLNNAEKVDEGLCTFENIITFAFLWGRVIGQFSTFNRDLQPNAFEHLDNNIPGEVLDDETSSQTETTDSDEFVENLDDSEVISEGELPSFLTTTAAVTQSELSNNHSLVVLHTFNVVQLDTNIGTKEIAVQEKYEVIHFRLKLDNSKCTFGIRYVDGNGSEMQIVWEWEISSVGDGLIAVQLDDSDAHLQHEHIVFLRVFEKQKAISSSRSNSCISKDQRTLHGFQMSSSIVLHTCHVVQFDTNIFTKDKPAQDQYEIIHFILKLESRTCTFGIRYMDESAREMQLVWEWEISSVGDSLIAVQLDEDDAHLQHEHMVFLRAFEKQKAISNSRSNSCISKDQRTLHGFQMSSSIVLHTCHVVQFDTNIFTKEIPAQDQYLIIHFILKLESRTCTFGIRYMDESGREMQIVWEWEISSVDDGLIAVQLDDDDSHLQHGHIVFFKVLETQKDISNSSTDSCFSKGQHNLHEIQMSIYWIFDDKLQAWFVIDMTEKKRVMSCLIYAIEINYNCFGCILRTDSKVEHMNRTFNTSILCNPSFFARDLVDGRHGKLSLFPVNSYTSLSYNSCISTTGCDARERIIINEVIALVICVGQSAFPKQQPCLTCYECKLSTECNAPEQRTHPAIHSAITYSSTTTCERNYPDVPTTDGRIACMYEILDATVDTYERPILDPANGTRSFDDYNECDNASIAEEILDMNGTNISVHDSSTEEGAWSIYNTSDRGDQKPESSGLSCVYAANPSCDECIPATDGLESKEGRHADDVKTPNHSSSSSDENGSSDAGRNKSSISPHEIDPILTCDKDETEKITLLTQSTAIHIHLEKGAERMIQIGDDNELFNQGRDDHTDIKISRSKERQEKCKGRKYASFRRRRKTKLHVKSVILQLESGSQKPKVKLQCIDGTFKTCGHHQTYCDCSAIQGQEVVILECEELHLYVSGAIIIQCGQDNTSFVFSEKYLQSHNRDITPVMSEARRIANIPGMTSGQMTVNIRVDPTKMLIDKCHARDCQHPTETRTAKQRGGDLETVEKLVLGGTVPIDISSSAAGILTALPTCTSSPGSAVISTYSKSFDRLASFAVASTSDKISSCRKRIVKETEENALTEAHLLCSTTRDIGDDLDLELDITPVYDEIDEITRSVMADEDGLRLEELKDSEFMTYNADVENYQKANYHTMSSMHNVSHETQTSGGTDDKMVDHSVNEPVSSINSDLQSVFADIRCQCFSNRTLCPIDKHGIQISFMKKLDDLGIDKSLGNAGLRFVCRSPVGCTFVSENTDVSFKETGHIKTLLRKEIFRLLKGSEVCDGVHVEEADDIDVEITVCRFV